MTAKHTTIQVTASNLEIAGVQRVRIGKVITCHPSGIVERMLHVETDCGDFRIKLLADREQALAIEVLNPITSI